MIQQFHTWIYIQKKTKTLIKKETHIPIFIATCMDLENVMFSKINQTKTSCMILLICGI